MPTRNASAVWEGGLQSGSGSYEGETGSVRGRYTAGSRFADAEGSNPEELLGAALAACFSMALSLALEKRGATPQRVSTEAATTVEKVGEGYSVTRIRLGVRGRASGIDQDGFREAAQETAKTCPVARALSGTEIEVEAELEG